MRGDASKVKYELGWTPKTDFKKLVKNMVESDLDSNGKIERLETNMKIQFIVCGWWYDEWDGKKNQTEFIDLKLYELKEENDNLDVMWTCHKTPPKIITEKFDYKEYENIGLEWVSL